MLEGCGGIQSLTETKEGRVDKAEIDEILEERYETNLEKIAKGGQHAVKVVMDLVSELEGDDDDEDDDL